MSDFLENYANKYMEVIELDGETALEQSAKDMVLSFAKSAVIAQKIQSLSDAGDVDVAAKTSALTDLAVKFNKAFPDLSDAEKAEVETVVAGIVTGDDELDAEAWFNSVLDGIGKGQKFKKAAAELLPVVE